MANPYAAPQGEFYQQPQQPVIEYASRDKRLLGAIIDGLVILPLAVPAGFAMGMAVAMYVENEIVAQLINSVVGGFIGLGMFLVLHGYLLATSGKTIGKWVMKTTIVDRQTHQLLPLPQLFIKRYLIMGVLTMIPFIGGLLGLINVLLIFRATHACLHDDLAGTMVINDPAR